MHDFKTIEDVGKEILLKLETKIHGVGLWIFYHNIVMERLEHWAVCKPGSSEKEKKSKDEAETNEKWKLTEKYVFQPTNIAFGEGSIGYALVLKKPSKIFNTFEDPRASVGYNDLELNQRSAYLYPFLNDKEEVECIFDFYHGNIGAFHKKEGLEKLINNVLNQHKKEILYLCEIERNKRSLLTVTSNLTSLMEHNNAALQLITFLTPVIPVPMVLHEERKQKNVVSAIIAIDRNVLAQKITSDLFWCSFKSKCCETCFFQKPLGLKGSLDSECLTGILLSDRKMALSRWDSFKLDEKYRLWFCLKAEAKLDNERKECFTQLKTFADEFTKAFSTQKDKEFELTKDMVLNMVLNAIIHLEKQESKVLFELLEQRLKNSAFSRIFQDLLLNKAWLKKNMAFLLLSRIDKKGFAWNPVENPNIEVYPKKHLLKQRAAILPLYKALSNPKILSDYPPTLQAEWIITTIDSEKNTINIPAPNGEGPHNIIKWKWQKGPHTNIVFFWANTACFYDEVTGFCHDWLKNKAVDGTKLNELLNIDCYKPEFPTPNHEEGFKFYYRTGVSSKKKSQQSKNIETFVSFAENFYEAQKQEESARGHALKAAIAAIMSRNMSHNIGSHVLINMEKEKTVEPGDIQQFHKYLRSRMDFLAQVSTDWPAWSMPTRFIQDLMCEFFQQIYILKFIGASEDLDESKLKFYIAIDEEILGPCPLDDKNCIEQLRKKVGRLDRVVSILGGITGRQAFYVILENIIRNAAKHSYTNKERDLKIHIALTEGVQDYQVEIWDSVSKSHIGDDEQESLVARINKSIQAPIIDETSSIKRGNWGIAEMKIASAYLQKKDLGLLGGTGRDNYKFIEASEEPTIDGGILKYTFCLQKPKEVAIWDLRSEGMLRDSDKFRRNSIFVKNVMDFSDTDYEFLAIIPDKGEKRKVLDEVLQNIEKLPYRLFFAAESIDNLKRIVPLQNLSTRDMEDDNGSQKFKIRLYAEWIKHLRDKIRNDTTNKRILLYLKLTERESQGNGAHFSPYLKTYYKYLIPSEIDTPNELGSAAQGWNGFRNEVLNDECLNKIIASICLEKEAIDTSFNNTLLVAYPRHLSIPSYSMKCIYKENLSGASPHFNLFASPPADIYMFKKLALWLVENGLIRIAIVDERIVKCLWNYSSSLNDSGIFLVSQITKEGMPPLPIGVNCSWNRLSEDDNGNITLSRKTLNSRYETIVVDMLVIHQGILDKMKRDGFWKDEDGATRWIAKIKEKIPFVVVTSGRGKPDEVPENAKFVPFSDIQQAFSTGDTHHGKLLLTSVLMNAKNKN